jgi:hypothetical protein
MLHRPPLGVASTGQLSLFDERYVGWPGDVTATWLEGPDPAGEGDVAARHRAAFWMRVGDFLSAERLLLSDALAVALHELVGLYAANERTSAKVIGEVQRFVRYASACGVEYLDELRAEHVECYLWAATSSRGAIDEAKPRTAANRQAFVRRFLDVLGALGLWSGGDIVGAPIDRGVSETSRPLTDEEMRLVEVYSADGLFIGRRPMQVAFAQAGADASEIATVTVNDVDLLVGSVTLGLQHRRTNPLTPWGIEVVGEYLAAMSPEPGQPLCVLGGKPLHRLAHSVTVSLRGALIAAHIGGRPRVTARSIGLWSAARVLERDGVVAAARFLGSNSLDATAASLGFDWQAG